MQGVFQGVHVGGGAEESHGAARGGRLRVRHLRQEAEAGGLLHGSHQETHRRGALRVSRNSSPLTLAELRNFVALDQMQPVRLRLKIEGRPTQPRQDEAQGRVRAAKADEHRVPRPLGKDAQQVKSQPQSQT